MVKLPAPPETAVMSAQLGLYNFRCQLFGVSQEQLKL